jgi:hypothetical protein
MGTQTPLRPARIVSLLIAVLAILALATNASAGAVQEPPDITFRILKLDCEEDPGQVPDGLTPEGCTPAEGVDFTIEVEGEEEALTCTTDAEGRCQVQVPSEANVTVTEDETTATEGFTPRENPIETQAVTEFAGAIFVNVADDEPPATETPPTDLPDTGAGTTASSPGAGAMGALAAVAALFVIAGTILRRHTTR